MEALGLDPALILAQIISFALLFTVLKKVLYPKIESALNDRRNAVKKTFEGQQEMEKRLAEFESHQKAQQTKAHDEIKKMLSQAKTEAQQIRQTMLSEAQAAATAQKAATAQQLASQQEQALVQLKSEAKKLAKTFVDELLAEKSQNSTWQKQQIDSSLKHLKTSHE